MPVYPIPIKEYPELDYKLGIKSSLSKIASVVALTYILYVVNDRKPNLIYSEEYTENNQIKIRLRPEILSKIKVLFPTIGEDLIAYNPLLNAQMEALQVGLQLIYRLTKVSFVDGSSSTKERTGGNRYAKQFDFGTNIKLLDLFLSAYSQENVSHVLESWLNNITRLDDNEISNGIKMYLSIFSEDVPAKIRDDNEKEIIFKQIGIYDQIIRGEKVIDSDAKENVGPFRIFKSIFKEGVHPFVHIDNGITVYNEKIESLREYSQLVNNSLSLSPKREVITTEVVSELKNPDNAETNNACIDFKNAFAYSFTPAMRTKPFLLLAGISGTGKSRIVKEMAFASCPPELRQDDVTPGNYCMIEVKPNWHDSTDLIGYVSSIPSPHYVVTPFINFLIKALHNPKVPFFVCLDEMNLAPVEQYFAEFLSVLESRKLVNGEIVSEPLIKKDIFSKHFNDFKHNYFRTEELAAGGLIPEEYAELWKELGDNGLRLPSNVIVVGTVNMDDTTYQFSRKVIDRAMTIEMNEVDFDSIFGESIDTLKYRDPHIGAEYFLPKYSAAKDALTALNDSDREYLKENIPATLKSMDAALTNTPFRIAYRVENELILYFAALREEKPDATADALLGSAVDDILMMKVLPRIQGNEDDLTEPLSRLENFTRENYPKAYAKVEEMQARLETNHFTSFWP